MATSTGFSARSIPKANRLLFSGKNLPTTSVTIYLDSRAAVVREIPTLHLKPGRNEITITDITNLAVKESFRVSTQAVVSDLCTYLTGPNFSSNNYEDSSSDEDDEDDTSPELKQVRETIATLQAESALLTERIDSNQEQKNLLQTHSNRKQQNVEEVLLKYAKTRDTLFKESAKLREDLEACRDELETFERKERKLKRAAERTMSPQLAARKLRHEKRKVQRSFQNPMAPSIYHPTMLFPPRTPSMQPPLHMSNSYNITFVIEWPVENDDQPSLKLSYTTKGASWRPEHSLVLDTTTGNGVLTYQAQYVNNTMESWNECTVTLSSTRNTAHDVEDQLPDLLPWNVGLAPKFGPTGPESDSGLYAPKEKKIRTLGSSGGISAKQNPITATGPPFLARPEGPGGFGIGPSPSGNHPLQDYQMQLMLLEEQGKRRMAMARAEQALGGPQPVLGGPSNPDTSTSQVTGNDPYDSDSSDDAFAIIDHLLLNKPASSGHGTIKSYELPGKRTVPSSQLERQQVITEFPLSAIEYYYVAIPKLRDTAVLNARIVNTSSIHLLAGLAGLTVDGIYLGLSPTPPCAPGGDFTISLGVDKNIKVRYSKPVQKQSNQAGFMGRNSELVQRFLRKFNVENTSSDPRPLKLVILDQIPVSRDERLKVTVVHPPGLKQEEDKIKVDLVGKRGHENVSAAVQLKKAGRISWEFDLSSGKKVEGSLEYEMRMPDSEAIVSR